MWRDEPYGSLIRQAGFATVTGDERLKTHDWR